MSMAQVVAAWDVEVAVAATAGKKTHLRRRMASDVRT